MVMVSAEEFVRAWQSSDSVREVMKKTGMLDGAVRNRALYLRKKGVPLKRLSSTRSRNTDWSAVAKLAQELAEHGE